MTDLQEKKIYEVVDEPKNHDAPFTIYADRMKLQKRTAIVLSKEELIELLRGAFEEGQQVMFMESQGKFVKYRNSKEYLQSLNLNTETNEQQ